MISNTHGAQAADFIRQREDDWARLEALMTRARGRAALSADEIRELGTLYRAVASDLAIARRDFPQERVVLVLNALLTRAHAFIYQEDVTDTNSLWRYFRETIPRAFRDTWRFTLVGFLLFVIPFIFGFRLTYTNPGVAASLGIEDARQQLADDSIWTRFGPEERPQAMAEIATNNIRVALLAFGSGLTLGIVTIYLMAYNGLVIGGVLGLAYHYGLGQDLLDFIFAHGVVELSVIFMAGGAGMQLGWAVLNPGDLTRRDSLIEAAKRAAPLVVIGVLLLLIAGTIEGFLSPSAAPFAVKVATGLGTGAAMYTYLLASGRRTQSAGSID